VQGSFNSLDWEFIENIPLSTTSQEDYWAWHYEKTGVFSVRSAYRLLVRSREPLAASVEVRPSQSNVSAEEKEWTELWSIKVP